MIKVNNNCRNKKKICSFIKNDRTKKPMQKVNISESMEKGSEEGGNGK